MNRLHLQLAFDHNTLDEAAEMAIVAAPLADTLEIGTPLLIREGVAALTRLRQAVQGTECHLFADTKISDEGEAISRICFEAGADAVSVVDGASRATLRIIRDVADQYGREVWVDMMNDTNPIIRARALAPFVDGFVMHRPEAGIPRPLISGLLALDRPIRLAGGLTLDTAREAVQFQRSTGSLRAAMAPTEGIIVGRAITEAANFEETLRAFAYLCHDNDNPEPTS
jgi:3-keto-L-gulonate-6-phosphate decarboxylase